MFIGKKFGVSLAFFTVLSAFVVDAGAAVFQVDSVAALRQALFDATKNSEDDTIQVAAGTYDLSGGKLVYAPGYYYSGGQGSDNHALVVEGAGAGATILDGGNDKQIMFVYTSSLPSDNHAHVTIGGVTFQNGKTPVDPNGGVFENGGGLWAYTNSASITVKDSEFLHNTVSGQYANAGGAYLASVNGGTVTVRGCLFSDNAAPASGGGLMLGSYAGTFVISGNRFVGNSAAYYGGGVSLTNNSATGTFANNVVSGNTAPSGAGVDASAYGGTLTLVSNVIHDNTGGALRVYARNDPKVNLVNNTVTRNGSGLSLEFNYCTEAARAEIHNNVLWANTTGGDLVISGDAGTIVINQNIYTQLSSGLPTQRTGNLNADPLFLDPAAGDFRTPVGSPCTDGGTNAVPDPPGLPAVDILGEERLRDGDGDGVATVDIGAYEQQESGYGDIATDAAFLEFGDVVPGYSRKLSLKVSNGGTAYLTIEGARISGAAAADFSQTGSCTRIAPAGFCTMTVTFKPVAAGLKEAALELDSRDPDTPTLDVLLHGLARISRAFRVDGTSGNDANNGQSWGSPLKTIQAAAAAAVDGDEIWVRGGTYTVGPGQDGVVVTETLGIYGGFAGTESAREQRDPAVHEVVVNGANQVRHVFRIAGNVRLDGITVTGGKAEVATNYEEKGGGGVYVVSGSPVLAGCRIRNNSAEQGGGVFTDAVAGTTLTLEESEVSDNTATYSGGGLCTNIPLTVRSCDISRNSAVDYGGGIRGNAAVVLSDSLVSHNVSGYGGGLYVPQQLSATNSTFRSNAANGSGGGIEGSGTVLNSVIRGNSARFNGGGINFEGIVANCLIFGNSTGNTVNGYGAGIFSWGHSGLTVSNCTIVNNSSAYWAGGVGTPRHGQVAYPPKVSNSILWGNTAVTGSQVHPSTGDDAVVVQYSDIDQDGYAGNGNIRQAPSFKNPANQDFHLLPASPGIDAASSDLTAADLFDLDGDGNTAEKLPFDIDGAPRFADVAAVPDAGAGTPPYGDMGADEFYDADGDGVQDGPDNCTSVPNADQADADGDGVGDACDGCASDPLKTAPGVCGCGVAETDTDGDTTPDCADGDDDNDGVPDGSDGCPLDAGKTAPGICGCGTAETDSDSDGAPDCTDSCPADPLKTGPGLCGCGVSEADTDSDGMPNCIDGCPNDPLKITPGLCGCGVADTDGDGDGTPNCADGCPADPLKTAPGLCGCGTADTNSDGDGSPDCTDGCPFDPSKTTPGLCGCGTADSDGDGDGVPNCTDNCDSAPNVDQGDGDGDGAGDACDGCAADPFKTEPGLCGCGTAETDSDLDGAPDCIEQDAPNGGDGNGDGIPDFQQAQVATVATLDGSQVFTIAAPDGATLSGVSAVANPSPADTPGDAYFPVGLYRFTVHLPAAGSAAAVTVYLPEGTVPSTYYKYGKTPDNPTPHWYVFSDDGQTGARVEQGRVVLNFVDGGRGDDDLAADAVVRDDGGPAAVVLFSPRPGSSWEQGSAQDIRWRTSLFPRSAEVRISYSLDAGTTWKTIAGRWPNSGRYRWNVPRPGTGGAVDSCQVRVAARSRRLLSGAFSIGSPTIRAYGQSGRAGETTTLTGDFFGDREGKVLYGGVRAVILRGGWTPTSVQAVIPESALTGPVTLVTRSGNRTTTVGAVVILPRVSSLAPTSGHAGQNVAIQGSGFGDRQGSGAVSFGGTAAEVVAWSNQRITARVPAAAASGKVRVVNGAGDLAESPAVFEVLP